MRFPSLGPRGTIVRSAQAVLGWQIGRSDSTEVEVDQELVDFLEQRFEKSERRTQELVEGLRSENRTMLEEARAENRAENQQTRVLVEENRAENRQTRVLVEDLRGQIQLVAEGVTSQHKQLEGFREEVAEEFREVKALVRLSYAELEHRMKGLEVRVTELDDRLTALENAA